MNTYLDFFLLSSTFKNKNMIVLLIMDIPHLILRNPEKKSQETLIIIMHVILVAVERKTCILRQYNCTVANKCADI